jgi:hypothetical protein
MIYDNNIDTMPGVKERGFGEVAAPFEHEGTEGSFA